MSTPRPRARRHLVWLTGLRLPLPTGAWPQGVQATVSGIATDDSGGVVPGVTVTMVNKTTNDARTTVTDERGRTGSAVCAQSTIS